MRWSSVIAVITALITSAVASQATTWSVPEAGTLSEVVETYADGDTILLSAGRHAVQLDVRDGRGLILIGEDRETTFLIGLNEIEPVLRIDAMRRPVVLRNLTFDRQDEGSVYTTILTRAQLTVDNCSFWGGAASLVDSCEGTWTNCDFQGCFDGVNLRNSPMTIQNNIFENTQQYAIITRGSEAKIYNNQFNRSTQASIIVTGKRRFPVIGGSPGKGNIFLQHTMYTV
ncbi:MAG: right-handed parallel beta-helix repeat-containing protein, partial [Gemmatimonadetes bacterium]|nr:right-handed parallel beta-helix repeat-containing protein [Gemmatimonadota bacterium]